MDDGRDTFPSDSIRGPCANGLCHSKPPKGFVALRSVTITCSADGTKANAFATATSIVSQDDANAKAQAMAEERAIIKVNCSAHISRTTIFRNTVQSVTATCPDGYAGESVTKEVPAGTISSLISQDAADAGARALGFTQAQNEIVCSRIIFWNTEQTHTATCPDGTTGEPSTSTKPEHTVSSYNSQAEADGAALQIAIDQANTGLSCSGITYQNTEQSYTAACPEGRVGDDITATVLPGTFNSTVSQADADSIALSQARAQAESELVCEELICCLYPYPRDADDNELYPFEDWPEPVVATFGFVGGGPYTLVKTSDLSVHHPWTGPGYYFNDGTNEVVIHFGGILAPRWELDATLAGNGSFSFDTCLIADWRTELTVADEFLDTYTVSGVTLTRINLCTWTGGGRTLRYNSTTYKWQLDGVAKTDPQNTPGGVYGSETI